MAYKVIYKYTNFQSVCVCVRTHTQFNKRKHWLSAVLLWRLLLLISCHAMPIIIITHFAMVCVCVPTLYGPWMPNDLGTLCVSHPHWASGISLTITCEGFLLCFWMLRELLPWLCWRAFLSRQATAGKMVHALLYWWDRPQTLIDLNVPF